MGWGYLPHTGLVHSLTTSTHFLLLSRYLKAAECGMPLTKPDENTKKINKTVIYHPFTLIIHFLFLLLLSLLSKQIKSLRELFFSKR